MATPGFGFSVGDFIAAIELVTKVAKALKDTGGAADDSSLALQELEHLQLVLEQLEHMPASGFQSQNHLNAVKAMALTIRIPLIDFLLKLEKFKLLQERGSEGGMKMRKTKLKIQWATIMQAEVTKMRAILTMKIVTISVLLTLPTNAILNQLNGKISKAEDLMNDLQNTVRKSIEDVSSKQDALQSSITASNSAIELDNTRLLMVCAGLRVGVSRLEKRYAILQRNSIKNHEIICQVQKGQIEVQASLRSTELTVGHTRLIVGQLLVNFAKFSSQVLGYLRALHQSNMEIYLLLIRLINSLPQTPANLLEDNIIFIDALQRRHSLQYTYFSEWDVFESMLRCKFKDFPAYESIMRGDYVIMDTKRSGSVILKSAWRRSVFPGSILDMSIIIDLLGQTEAKGNICPRPLCGGNGIFESAIAMTCQDCGLQFIPFSDKESLLGEPFLEASDIVPGRERRNVTTIREPRRTRIQSDIRRASLKEVSSDLLVSRAVMGGPDPLSREIATLEAVRKVHIRTWQSKTAAPHAENQQSHSEWGRFSWDSPMTKEDWDEYDRVNHTTSKALRRERILTPRYPAEVIITSSSGRKRLPSFGTPYRMSYDH